MIEIIGNKDYTVYYRCDCGVAGQCIVKPLSEEGTIITNITCPVCRVVERVKLEQREGKVDSSKFSWAVVVYNEITDYELKEDLDD